jgi:hypothetical protein
LGSSSYAALGTVNLIRLTRLGWMAASGQILPFERDGEGGGSGLAADQRAIRGSSALSAHRGSATRPLSRIRSSRDPAAALDRDDGRHWTTVRERLFDHFFGSHSQLGRNFDAKCCGGFDINRQDEPRRLIDRQIGGFCALKNLVHIAGESAAHGGIFG